MRIKLATIKDLTKIIESENQKNQERIQVIANDNTLKDTYKKEQIQELKANHRKRIIETQEKIFDTLAEIQSYVNRPIDVLNGDFVRTIESINTLGKLITNEDLKGICNKYRGNENALKKIKAVCKNNGIGVTVFDDYMFTREEDAFSLGSTITLDDYFGNIKNHINNDVMFNYDMNRLSKKLGEEISFDSSVTISENTPFTVKGFF